MTPIKYEQFKDVNLLREYQQTVTALNDLKQSLPGMKARMDSPEAILQREVDATLSDVLKAIREFSRIEYRVKPEPETGVSGRCPKCHLDGELDWRHIGDEWWIICTKCGACGPSKASIGSALSAWVDGE